ncbi:replication initiator [Kitasatospora indigofera]|uniref:replication initiator n=1 Tax=Kitasatospora indigofera TaxID=67307 RepID=UPI00365E48ED
MVSAPSRVSWIRATGGCAAPVHLAGHTTTLASDTGEVLRHYTTATEPGGRLAVRCRNRRASRCAPCSREHSGDTFHLVRAGLSGGKGVPDSVRTHPRLFVTLTAPSFGRVHRVGVCRPARHGRCEHSGRHGCGGTHPATDVLVGQPLCTSCYDYPGHVLWNASAPPCGRRFVTTSTTTSPSGWGRSAHCHRYRRRPRRQPGDRQAVGGRAVMTLPGSSAVADWIAEILSKWVPPEDYDAQLSGVVAGYVSDRQRACAPPPGTAGQPE